MEVDSRAGKGVGFGSRRKRKSQVLQCRYCSSTFRRVEHFERHERTHTKEKPFVCGCGKKFGRRDILQRHEKLVHSSPSGEGVEDVSGIGTQSGILLANPTTDNIISPNGSVERIPTSLPQADPEPIPIVNESSSSHEPIATDPTLEAHYLGNQSSRYHFGVTPMPGVQFGSSSYSFTGLVATTPEDYNLFLDHFDLANLYIPSSVFDTELPTSLWSRPEVDPTFGSHLHGRSREQSQEELNSLSRFGSRLPSLQPEDRNPIENEPLPRPQYVKADPPWKISAQDHKRIKVSLETFANVLPDDFSLPTRHALSRFFEGYISGFHQHLPFLHIPTLNAADCTPELLLAIVAVGAQYRFESTKGYNLWFTARTVAFEQIKRRHSQTVADITSLSSTTNRGTCSHSPLSSNGTLPSHSQLNGDVLDLQDPRKPMSQARLRTIQSLLILMAGGMWGPQVLFREATALQNQLALLVREQGLVSIEQCEDNLSWEDWVHIEGDRRTKFLTYCFFNLHSIAYNSTPLLLASEMEMNLPQSSGEWQADSSRQWQSLRRAGSRNTSFHYVLSKLFDTEQPNHAPLSSLGNYVLIHAIIQQIFFVRQTFTIFPKSRYRILDEDTIKKYERILRFYQVGWEKAPESSLDPANPYGPVAFSSTALLRLAYIRLHCDLGPCRKLDTRDPRTIAYALQGSPPLARSPLLSRAILQAAHALSIPVKIGVKFVAHTQTLMWSMQHSLCNLECALFLSKWLFMISGSISSLTMDEQHLLQMVRSILDETDFAVSFGGDIAPEESIRQLGTAVVHLWAETFSGSHHVFPLVRNIGTALEISVNLLEGVEVLS